MPRFILITVAVVALGASCRRSSEPNATPAAQTAGPPTVTIWISKPGTIELDGHVVALSDVAAALDKLPKDTGQVIFGQDMPGAQPTPNVIEVLKMISERGLTFRSAHDRSFKELAPDHHYDKNAPGGP
jgi:hypothetical protein